MVDSIIDTIANDLIKLQLDPDLALTNPKLYSSKGLILDQFARSQRISTEALKKLIKSNTFFKLGGTNIKTGFFSKRDKTVETIEWEENDKIKDTFTRDRNKVIKDSLASVILTQRSIQLLLEERSKGAPKLKLGSVRTSFRPPSENRTQLYQNYFPEELEKYKREGRIESNLEKKFLKRVAKGSEFHLSDGKVAHNIYTWFLCVQMTAPDIVVAHIKNQDFQNWFAEKVKAPELAEICSKIAIKLQNSEIMDKEVRHELLRAITKTTLNNIIFDTIILPLLRKAKSTDQATTEEAIDKLFMLGDTRIVEPLLDRLFDSQPQVRQKIVIGLGKLADKRATPTLIKILRHSKDANDRLFALRSLGQIGDLRAKSVLAEITNNKNDLELSSEAKKILTEKFKTK